MATFETLRIIEPGLTRLANQINTEYFVNSNLYWYRSIKPQMVNLVGFDAKNPGLRSSGCYDTCYKALSQATDRAASINRLKGAR